MAPLVPLPPSSRVGLAIAHRTAIVSALGCPTAFLELRLLAPDAADPSPLRTAARALTLPGATSGDGVSARVDRVVAVVNALLAPTGSYSPGMVVVATAGHDGPFGAIALNDALRDVCNPNGAPTGFTAQGDIPIRVGDPLTVRGNLFRQLLWDGQRALVVATSRHDERGTPTLLLTGDARREAGSGLRLLELSAIDLRAFALGYADTVLHLTGMGHEAGAVFRLNDVPEVLFVALDGPRGAPAVGS